MIKIYYRNIKDKRMKTLSNFRAGSWIYAENPNSEEILNLSKDFNLEEDLLQDALDQQEVPRVEFENNVTYIFTRIPYQEQNIITVPILIAMGGNFVLTLSQKKLSVIEKFIESKDFYTTQKTKFVIQLFFNINSWYSKFLTSINKSVRGIKVRLEKIQNKDLVHFVNFEEILNDFLSALVPTTAILQKLLTGGYLKLYEEDKDLIEDLFVGNRQLVETSKSTLKSIVNIRNAYSTIMTQNLNRIIKLLTALTIILTVPTIIASIYGMNIPLPYQESPYAFSGIMGVTVFIIFLLLIIFIRNKWL